MLDRECLIELAGERAFRRGEEYFRWRRVRSVAEAEGNISGVVDGTTSYRVGLRRDGNLLGHECDCPGGAAGRFCKHCVAVGLDWLEARRNGQSVQVTAGQEVYSYLAQLVPQKLVALVLGRAARDATFRERLRLRAARTFGTEPDLSEQRRLLEFAVEAAEAVEDATAMNAVLKDVETALSHLLEEGFAGHAASLTENALAFRRPNPTEGGEKLLAVLLAYHRESCQQAGITTDSLAGRLLEWQLQCPVLARGEVTEEYSNLLGRRGWKAYRQLAQTEWDYLLQTDGNLHSPEQRELYVHLATLMEYLARKRGDAATLIAIKSHSLEDANSYLEIARLCKQTGNEKLALEWAQRGADRFQAVEGGELYEFLAEEYVAQGAPQKALAIFFAQYCGRPSLRGYQKIADCAWAAGERDDWCERALNLLRTPDGSGYSSSSTHFSDFAQSTLVSILLWENEDEAAYQAARLGDCNDDLWREIARRRTKTHPEDALLIYKQLVQRYAGRKNRYSYAAAIEILRRIKLLLRKQDREDEFIPYVESLCRTHRYQHNLLKMLRALMARHSRGKHEGRR